MFKIINFQFTSDGKTRLTVETDDSSTGLMLRLFSQDDKFAKLLQYRVQTESRLDASQKSAPEKMARMRDHLSKMLKMFRERGGKIRDLLDDSAEARAYAKSAYRKGLGPAKYLPKDFKMGTDMLIAGDKVSLISYSAMVGLLIENAEIAQTQKQTFEFMWKHL